MAREDSKESLPTSSYEMTNEASEWSHRTSTDQPPHEAQHSGHSRGSPLDSVAERSYAMSGEESEEEQQAEPPNGSSGGPAPCEESPAPQESSELAQLRRELAELKQSLLNACVAQVTKQEQLIAGFTDAVERRHRPPCAVPAAPRAPQEDDGLSPGGRAPDPPQAPSGRTGSAGQRGELPDAPGLGRSGSWQRHWTINMLRSFRPSMTAGGKSVHLAVLNGLDQQHEEQQQEMMRIKTQRSNVAHVVSQMSRGDRTWAEWVTETMKEPPRVGPLASFVKSTFFSALTVLAILLNGSFILWQTNKAMSDVSSGSEVSSFIEIEFIFLVVFVVELVLKLLVHRVYFFVGENSYWNIFDGVVVFVSMLDFVVTYFELFQGMNITFLRICRLFKVSKVARIFRAFRFFKELRLLLKCLMNCFASLFWSGVLLLFIKFLFGLYFVQTLTTFIEDELQAGDGLSSEQLEQTVDKFGSVQISMITLLMATTGGESWSVYYELLSMTGIFSTFLFLFYIVFFMVAVWNIVTSVFIEKIMVLAGPTIEEAAFERRRQQSEDAVDLLDMAKEMDKDGTGQISLDEFIKSMEDSRCRSYFAVRGVDVKDGVTFFNMLATVSGMKEVPLDVFVNGCLRLRGPASSIDLHTFNYESKLMNKNAEKFQRYCSDQFQALTLLFNVLAAELGCSSDKLRGARLAAEAASPGADGSLPDESV